MTIVKNLRQLFRKEVVAIYVMVFIADMVSGIISPTFSLYAKSLGASLTLIGALSGIVGLTRMVSAVPMGVLSDSRGRKNVLSAGMLLFAVSTFLYTVVPTVYFLFPARVLAGLAMVSTFTMGVAYVGDNVARHERGLAVGLYATAMGLGFAIGPIIGGQVAAAYGYRASYRVAALLALVGFVIARRWLVRRPPGQRRAATPTDISLFTKLRLMAKDPDLLAASLANMFISVVFAGAIINFFPLYAASLSIGEATIGSMLATRALVSTLARLPTGLLTTRFSNRNLMLTALALAMVMVFSISRTATPWALGILLAGEGIAFGMFITAGQTFITERFTEADRGTAIGVYGTAGSIGATFGPFIQGLIADLWGLTTVFQVTGVLVFVGTGMLWYMRVRKHRAPVVEELS